MEKETVKDFYNRQYSEHIARGSDCPHAVHELDKARDRVRRVSHVLGAAIRGDILDVGSGLGCYTKALSEYSVCTVGLDFSEAAIDAARKRFAECRFVCGAWPDGVERAPRYDLIWMVNFSLMNTFDVEFIRERLVDEALARLRAGGQLVVGWNTDLSGIARQGYSHWGYDTLANMRRRCQLSEPMVPVPLGRITSGAVLRAGRMFGRSVPIFMLRRK